MRSDAQKIVCERPRYHDDPFRAHHRQGRSKSLRMKRRFDVVVYDDGEMDVIGPIQLPVSRFAKGLSDFLSPLKGWIAKQVGRPYVKVHSELCRMLGGNGVMQRHIREHASQYMLSPEEVEIIDGVPYERKIRFERKPIECDTVYTDPRDGILKWGTAVARFRFGMGKYNHKAQQRQYQKLPRKEGAVVQLPDSKGVLHRTGGKWYWKRTESVWVRHPPGHHDWRTGEYVDRTVDALASNTQLKKLGYRPEKKRKS